MKISITLSIALFLFTSTNILGQIYLIPQVGTDSKIFLFNEKDYSTQYTYLAPHLQLSILKQIKKYKIGVAIGSNFSWIETKSSSKFLSPRMPVGVEFQLPLHALSLKKYEYDDFNDYENEKFSNQYLQIIPIVAFACYYNVNLAPLFTHGNTVFIIDESDKKSVYNTNYNQSISIASSIIFRIRHFDKDLFRLSTTLNLGFWPSERLFEQDLTNGKNQYYYNYNNYFNINISKEFALSKKSLFKKENRNFVPYLGNMPYRFWKKNFKHSLK